MSSNAEPRFDVRMEFVRDMRARRFLVHPVHAYSLHDQGARDVAHRANELIRLTRAELIDGWNLSIRKMVAPNSISG